MAESLREFIGRRKSELLAELMPAEAAVAKIQRELADIEAAELGLSMPTQLKVTPTPAEVTEKWPIREVAHTWRPDAGRPAEDAIEPPPIAETAPNMQSESVADLVERSNANTLISLMGALPEAAPPAPASDGGGTLGLMGWILAVVGQRYPHEGPMPLVRLRELVIAAESTRGGIGTDCSLQEICLAVEALAERGDLVYRTVHRDQPMMVSLPGLPEGADGVGPTATPQELAQPALISAASNKVAKSEVTAAAEDPSVIANKILDWLPTAFAEDPKGPTISDCAKRFVVDPNTARDAFRVIARSKLADVERRGDTGAYHVTPKDSPKTLEDLSALQEEVLGAVLSNLSADGLCRLLPPAIAMDVGKPQGSIIIITALEALRKKGYLEGSIDKKNYWHKPVQPKA